MTMSDAAWCQQLFRMLSEGGVWGVPRSGLVFKKTGGKLVLDSAMPFEPGMPGSAELWTQYQNDDFDAIREHFAAAGIEVARTL